MSEIYPTILFFSSKHCAPCRDVEEKLKRINISMFGKKLLIEKVDIEESFVVTKNYQVFAVPTLIVGDKRLTVSIQEEDIIDAILFAICASVRL